MRWRDLVRLAVFALTQHRLRTALTTLGVMFGSLVLVVSLSVRLGVQDTIVREVGKHQELRHIGVSVKTLPQPVENVTVKGTMSDDRRERLKKLLRQRRAWRQERSPVRRLSPECIRELAALDHVVRADLPIQLRGRAFLGDRSEHAGMFGIAERYREEFRRCLLMGELPGADDPGGVAVSEFLLYELGMVDEADQARLLGRELTFEVRIGDQPQSGFLLRLLTGGGDQVRVSEEQLLDKVLQRLPGSLEQMGLSPQEAKMVRGMLALARPTRTKPEVLRGSYKVRGVLGAPNKADTHPHVAMVLGNFDLLLAPAAAEAFYRRLPEVRENGFSWVSLEVDEMDHVKAVQEQVKAMGFDARSAMDQIEREQFIYLVVFTGMSAVALIALVVAAIGITNTMLMSVLERVREIGIMKATGARDGHILMLFLMEGALIGLAGGLLGLACARGFAIPADAWLRSAVAKRLNVELTGSLFAFPWWLIVGAPLFAILVATLAAGYPARRAVRIDPVQALRHE